MKFHIYKTPWQILEKPIVSGTCNDFKENGSVLLHTTHFGKHTYETEKVQLCNQHTVKKRSKNGTRCWNT